MTRTPEASVARRAGEPLLMALVAVAGLALRAYRLDWGLPRYVFPDAAVHFIRPAAAAAAGGPASPEEFVHPTGVFVLLTAAFRLWSALSGRPIRLGGGDGVLDLATLALVGRVVMVATAGLSIVALWALGRRLLGPRAALLAAACFALAPLHVLESHRVAPDVPMILATVVGMHLAVIGGGARVLGSFALAGVAAATKYPGLFAAAVPAWVSRRRPLLLAAGAVAAAAGFALVCAPCLIHFDAFRRGLHLVGSYGYVIGMPGTDLAGSFPQQRWVYAPLVALPYMMGWPAYAAALAGLVLLWRSDRGAAGILLAATVPYLAFMGGAISAVPRYYLLVCPALALAAGSALDRLWSASRALGRLAVVGILAYTALLSASQVARLGLGPQRAVAALIAHLATDAAGAERRKLVVAYPNRFALPYDALTSLVRGTRLEIVEFPEPYGHLGASDDAPPPADPAAWVVARRVDVLVLPSWTENAVLRSRGAEATRRFFRGLEDGTLGLRPAGDFRTHYLTERLYTWGDPMLDTHWETAIAGYKVFVRERRDRS